MISRLRGILVEKRAPSLLIEVGGVGYEVFMPVNTFYLLPPLGKEIIIHTHFVVREHEQTLYGFIEENQRTLFRTLIKVNGVGPKVALTILSGVETDVLVQNILQGDVSNLIRVRGVGAKTAQRLIVEMRDKIAEHFDLLPDAHDADENTVRDAISALIALGYKPQEAHQAIHKHKEKKLPSEELVRLALREM